MFFRRVFSRKERSAPAISCVDHKSYSASTIDGLALSPKRSLRKSTSNDDKRGLSVLQLTPLWEHIIRTKSLPSNICEKRIFDEFVERLHDPEWQVRQHALRVLVDVLIVMGPRSDQYFQPLLFPLIENLGHAAPVVRKGALDAMKVYMTETDMVESILSQIIDLGMERKSIQEKYGGRLCVGTMLTLPALVHTCLSTSKQSFALKIIINALANKMIMMPYQEVALKVLLRIREMIGVREFSEYIAHGAYKEFELLCNVYGLQTNPDSEIDSYMPASSDNVRSWQLYGSNSRENHCKVKRTELNWRNDDDELYSDDLVGTCIENNNNKYRKLPGISSKPYSTSCPKSPSSQRLCTEQSMPSKSSQHASIRIGSAAATISDMKCDKEKVIMETEIKIQDTPVTMRIVEAQNEFSGSSFTDEENGSVYEHSGVVRVLTDSELEEVNNNLIDTVPRTPKRVTFGGEEVKMRTPDSDSILQSDNDDLNRMAHQLFELPQKIDIGADSSRHLQKKSKIEKMERPQTASSASIISSNLPDNQSRSTRYKSASPIKGRPSYGQSSSENMSLSPRATHKGIEVLHNLQRSPSISPNRSRREFPEKAIDKSEKSVDINKIDYTVGNQSNISPTLSEIFVKSINTEIDAKTSTWESLVDDECLHNIKSEVSFPCDFK